MRVKNYMQMSPRRNGYVRRNIQSTKTEPLRNKKSMLNSNGESGHPCLVPDFRGDAFNFLPLRIMFAVGLSYMVFIVLRYVPSIPAFWRVFIIKRC